VSCVAAVQAKLAKAARDRAGVSVEVGVLRLVAGAAAWRRRRAAVVAAEVGT
jgi:hypothetical protein